MSSKATCLALAAGLGLAVPAPLYAASPVAAKHVAAEHIGTPVRPAPSANDAHTYAQREKQDPKAAEYRGGERVVVISVTTGALLVIILFALLLWA